MSEVKKFTERRSNGEYFGEANFDSEGLIVKDVTLLGAVSANGYTYSEKALKEATALLEGASQYINHPSSETDVRGIERLFGTVRNVRFVPSEMKVRGDTYLVDTPMVREEILPRMKHFKEKIGNSIVAYAESVIDDNDKETVTHISEIVSVDLVTDPATNKGLFEGIKPKDKKTKKEVNSIMEFTIEDVRKNAKVMEALKAEIMEGVESQKELEALKKENKFLKEQNDKLSTKVEEYEIKEALDNKKDLVDRLITESALPEKDETIVTKRWRESLYTKCEDEVDIKNEIAEREAFYKNATSKGLNKEHIVTVEEAEKNLDFDDAKLEQIANSF